MTKVTVVIPVYNVEKYLRECLDSVCGQTLKDLQIICIDDCSPDGCGAILDEYAAKDGRFTVFHLEQNRMQGYGRNLGLDHAEGKYVYFLDSDDKIEPDALQVLYDRCAPDGIEVAVFGYKAFYDKEELRKRFPQREFIPEDSPCRNHFCTGSELFDDMMLRQYWTAMPISFFWKTDMLKRCGIRFPEEIFHEDEFFSYSGMLSAERATCVPEPLACRRFRENSVVTTPYDCRNAHGYMMNTLLMTRFVQERDIHTFASQREIGIMFFMFRNAFREVDYDELRAFCREKGEEDLRLFDYLTSGAYAAEYSRFLPFEVLKTAQQYRTVTVYGTGNVSRQFSNALKITGGILRPVRYLTEDPVPDGKRFMGAPVVRLDSYEQEDGDLVIAAVPYDELLKVRGKFRKRGIRWIYYEGKKQSLLKKAVSVLKKL